MWRFLLTFLLPFGKADTTFLSFSRRIVTCDPQDNPLEEATSKMVWAYNDNDPVNDNSILQHQERGVKSVRFFTEDSSPNNLPSDVQTLDLELDNEHILFNGPDGDTTTQYWCKAYQIQNTFSAKRQIIRVEPIIQAANANNVHHILVYQCESFNATDLAWQGGCYQRDTPINIESCNFGQLIASWAIGGFPFNYPEHIGLPIQGDNIFLLMETHYDNPQSLDIWDSSGLRLYHTAQMRQYDASIMPMGYDVDSIFTIPPGQTSFTYNAYCPSECTTANFPPGGINITATMMHTHLAGRQAFFRQFRNDTELVPIISEPYYDFNYQELQLLTTERTILPGDMLQVECIYNTVGRVNNTEMGRSTRDEMCLAYMLYYPKLDPSNEICIYGNFTGLRSTPTFQNQTIFCGNTMVQNWDGPPTVTPYVPPPCIYTPPPALPTTPALVNSLNKSFYQMNTTLDTAGKYRLYWTVDRVNLLFHAAVEVETTGWVGLGITPNGMEGSDVLIGWVKDGELHFADRFAPVKAMPQMDTLQDFYGVSGGQVAPEASTLSKGAITGIAVGATLGVLVLIGVAYFFYKRTGSASSRMEYEAMPVEGYGGTGEGGDEGRPSSYITNSGGTEKPGKEPVPL